MLAQAQAMAYGRPGHRRGPGCGALARPSLARSWRCRNRAARPCSLWFWRWIWRRPRARLRPALRPGLGCLHGLQLLLLRLLVLPWQRLAQACWQRLLRCWAAWRRPTQFRERERPGQLAREQVAPLRRRRTFRFGPWPSGPCQGWLRRRGCCWLENRRWLPLRCGRGARQAWFLWRLRQRPCLALAQIYLQKLQQSRWRLRAQHLQPRLPLLARWLWQRELWQQAPVCRTALAVRWRVPGCRAAAHRARPNGAR